MESILACNYESGQPEAVAILFVAMFALAIIIIVAAIKVLIFCMIFSKAGYSWALGLLMLVPIANIIMPFVLAFGDWPIRRELRLLKQKQNNTTG